MMPARIHGSLEYLIYAPAVLSGLFWLYIERKAKRRGTPKEQARRYIRDFEHRCLLELEGADTRVADGGQATKLMLRMLTEDLKQVVAKRRAIEFVRTHYGIDLDKPTEISPLFPFSQSWKRKLLTLRDRFLSSGQRKRKS